MTMNLHTQTTAPKRLLSPLEEALQGYVLTDGKLHADDTPVQSWRRRCGSPTARTEKASIR